LLIALFLGPFPISAQEGTLKQTGVLEKIVMAKAGNTFEVQIFLNVFPFYHQFELTHPNRLVIDFINTLKNNASASYKVNYFGVLAIRTGKFKSDITRVVFDMAGEIPAYKIESIQNGLKVVFGIKEEPKAAVKEIKIEDAICCLNITPVKAKRNDSISVDMSSSQHAESMEVDVFSPEGIKIESKKLSPDSPLWKTSFEKPGEYAFKGKAFNAKGKPSENPCQAAVHINFPPLSRLECRPLEDYIRKPIALDASASVDSDGEVVKVSFTIADSTGNLVDRFEDFEKPFSWEKSFEKEGNYIVTAIASDDSGDVSEPAKASVSLKPKPKKLFFLVDVGALAAHGGKIYAGYAAGRVGLLYKIIPRTLDFSLSGGWAHISNVPSWKSFFMVDALFNVHLGRAFFGAGAGMTSQFKESIDYSYGELIASLGFDVFRKPKNAGSIFLEARGPLTNISFEEHYRLMLGLRMLF
jgi:hypothetical protein